MNNRLNFLEAEHEQQLCIYYVPTAAHLGWGYGPYLGTVGGKMAGRRTGHGEFANYSSKYGLAYIQLAQQAVFEGLCFKKWMDGEENDLCKGRVSSFVPIDVDLYHGLREIPIEHLKRTFTRDPHGVETCFPKRRKK